MFNVCLSRSLSSPICGIAMKIMILMAAAYSDSPIRTYRWNSGAQLFALARKTATRNVPMQPITEYKNEAKDTLAWLRSSSWILYPRFSYVPCPNLPGPVVILTLCESRWRSSAARKSQLKTSWRISWYSREHWRWQAGPASKMNVDMSTPWTEDMESACVISQVESLDRVDKKVTLTWRLWTHKWYILSAKILKGPVTPRIVKGCAEKLRDSQHRYRNWEMFVDTPLTARI